jgi:RNA polymerase sigma-70 factor (ECF subfamily)
MFMLKEQDKQTQFEQIVLRHIDAAYNLARWIIKNDQDAEDIVQESFLRAYKYFSSYQGGNGRSWLLTIVRNTCYTWLHENQIQGSTLDLNEEISSTESDSDNPEQRLQIKGDQQSVIQALEKLPAEYRELIVLRELEEMSYKEIAVVTGIPIGTVMSRLARARQRLKECLGQSNEAGSNEL